MFNSDNPINNESKDILNRNDFAKKLANDISNYDNPNPITIGLIGNWGSGKSSLINLTLDNINTEDYLIIHFNPWFYSNQHNLFLQFFKLLLNEFKDKQDNTNTVIGRKLNHLKTMFQRPITDTLQNYYDYIKSNSSTNLKINDVSLSVTSNEESYESLVFHKNQCDTYFEHMDLKILVIIDDIDRLIDSEIKQVFTLVKSLADFPRFVYLLAFDKNVVAKSLDNLHSNHAHDFMNKIIQIQIPIPEISETKLDELILTNIEPIYTKHMKTNLVTDNEFGEVSKYLHVFIKDIRDLKRYINVLNFYLDIFADEINLTDYFLLLAIQVFEYKLYKTIKEHGDILTVNSIIFKKEPISIIDVDKVKKILENNIISHDKNKLIELLTFLFPVLDIENETIKYKADYEIWNQYHRICSENYFEKYYTLLLESNEVSSTLLNKLIKSNNIDEICNILLNNDNLDYNHSLLTKFRELIPEIPYNNISTFVNALMKCGDLIETYAVSRRTIEWILNDLMLTINNQNKSYDILKECLNYSNNILTVSEYIYSLAFSYCLAGSNKNKRPERSMPVNIEQTKQLITFTVAKIRKSSEKNEFLNHTFLQDILTYWELLDNKEIVKEYVLRNVNTDEEILSFLNKFQTILRTTHSLSGGTSKSQMRFDFKKLDTYHGLEFYENKITEMLNRFSLNEKKREFCELFIKQLNEYPSKMYPLFISHYWDYKDAYYTVEGWIDDSDISWKNMSIPAHDPKQTHSDRELEQMIDNNIRNSSIFIIIAGMYVSQENRIWINKEIEIAQKYNKPILAIKPWGNERTPTKIQEVADKLVNWQSSSVINGIYELIY